MTTSEEKIVDMRAVWRCLLMFMPFFVMALWSGDPLWTNALVTASATLVGLERFGMAPLGVLLHQVLIALLFLVLLFARQSPWLFVFCCAASAALMLAITAYGRRLRSLGTFIFVPALYLACEAADGCAPAQFASRAIQWLPYLLAGVLPVLLLSMIEHGQRYMPQESGVARHFLRLCPPVSFGEKQAIVWPMVTIAVSVSAAAALVMYWHTGHPQWVVWSAASVVTGDLLTARKKYRDRVLGAVVGVSIGLLLGILLPHSHALGAVFGMLACSTIFVFPRYIVGFGVRCTCSACALLLANQAIPEALGRLVNVALGGVIGVLFVYALHLLALSVRDR
jgi:hypothetical protein